MVNSSSFNVSYLWHFTTLIFLHMSVIYDILKMQVSYPCQLYTTWNYNVIPGVSMSVIYDKFIYTYSTIENEKFYG